MSATPTGQILREDGRSVLRIIREYSAPIDDVWAAVTESERMARWIGVWSGDPTSGRVAFRMTAEAEDAPPMDVEIRECDPPRVLRVTSALSEGAQWHLDVMLEERDGGTTLTFEQPEIDPAQAESVGPGWEYYLDRLAAALEGGDIAAVDFERDYYPAMSDHYRVEPE